MNVRVRLFASAREAAGVGHLLLELPDGATVRGAIDRITKLHPLVGEIRQLVIARNRDYVGVDERLADGDEIALIPPVSGGAVSSPERILVSAAPLSVDAAIDAVRGPDTGGIVVFLGTVRDESRGKRVRNLEYEAYAEMAEAKMREIAIALERTHAPLRVAMHHRVGDLALGEIAVIVAAAAPHRDAAFVAARAAIDELKRVVPIWKKEYTDDGAVWIEDHA
jgi:molybdopterin synthase catalytic subunit